MSLWIKICANTSLTDALAAVELGADAVGFVFAPSSRQVSAAEVERITAELPGGVERIGVFGRVPAEEIAGAASQAGLTGVQLHGGLDLALAGRIRELAPRLTILHTAHWNVDPGTASEPRVRAQLAELAEAAGEAPERILIDAKAGQSSGGLGLTYDWGAAAPVFGSQPSLRVIAAGGLRPENVADAVRALRPWGVDVASGVESAPGRKDPGKLRAFFAGARSV